MQQEPDAAERCRARAARLELERRHRGVVEEVDDEHVGTEGGTRERLPSHAQRRGVHDQVRAHARRARSNATRTDIDPQTVERGLESVTRAGIPGGDRDRGRPFRARGRARTRDRPRPAPKMSAVAPGRVEPDVQPEEPFEAGSIGVRAVQALCRRQTIVFTAWSRRASSESSSTSPATAALCGIVTFAPTNPIDAIPPSAAARCNGCTGSGT